MIQNWHKTGNRLILLVVVVAEYGRRVTSEAPQACRYLQICIVHLTLKPGKPPFVSYVIGSQLTRAYLCRTEP